MRFLQFPLGLSQYFAAACVVCVVDEALGHAYLSPHHDVNKESVCPTPFSFDFEHPTCTEEHIKEVIYKESVKFNPDHWDKEQKTCLMMIPSEASLFLFFFLNLNLFYFFWLNNCYDDDTHIHWYLSLCLSHRRAWHSLYQFLKLWLDHIVKSYL